MRYQDLYDEMTGGTARGSLPRWAGEVLAAIGSGDSPVVGVRHPLGFLCLPLERTEEHGVCVHIWSSTLPRAASTTSQIHCHSWDLVSHVLYGRVENVRADVGDATAGATHRVFEVLSDAEGDRIRPTPRTVRCLPGVSEVYGPGQTYTLPAGVFHASVIPGGETATIALGRGRPGRSDLSLGPPGLGAHLVPRHRCDARETARAALHAAGRLAERLP
ncbi:hypothetical protein [Streptosporangium roseum]|uniref:Uncharacterized protein n=1 Tax=Streptosporangium roseum (strain ATCC 12428 / DSM 43021 / JCM 3005 / KCTC 9067 / NCIMB 10171 / NRRL 2505 / NI 9100) TaxID=479432 RepID=D2B8E2_STRRD|nr:hypothetical protein [Streptosporangium roseum]ACZ85932.1 hypothetical protein Sros_2978 [Streptosporangium roseum DSM 43021]